MRQLADCSGCVLRETCPPQVALRTGWGSRSHTHPWESAKLQALPIPTCCHILMPFDTLFA